VDLNIDDRLAVCGIFKSNGTQGSTRFIRGGDNLNGRRKRLLGMMATKRSLTGSLNEGEQDHKDLWAKVNNIDDYEAHRVSRRIVEFALEHGASIIVFEHLGKFKPKKGKYNRRANSKRSYWLRGRIFHYTRYKAWEHGIITSRVNPGYTSRLCAGCRQGVGTPIVLGSPGFRELSQVQPAQPSLRFFFYPRVGGNRRKQPSTGRIARDKERG